MLYGLKEKNMPAAKQNATVGLPAREYPNEWTMYPADEEAGEPLEQRAGEADDPAEEVTARPHYVTWDQRWSRL